MSGIVPPEEQSVGVYPPEASLKRARSRPRREQLVVGDGPEDQWAAFQQVLAEA